MDTPGLTSSEYWQSDSVDLRLNPKRRIASDGLEDFLAGECGIRSAVVLATSGSSGEFKFVVLAKEALLASAEAVNFHCGFGGEDVSLAGLSGFHVGGLAIYARAYLSGGTVAELIHGAWQKDGRLLIESVERSGATLTSITPTHLHDLVAHEVPCPDSMRAVLLGGGRMDPDLVASARALGWPIRVSFGMTEAASQVATAIDGAVEWLPILPHWETRMAGDGRLAIRGKALFSGYVRRGDAGWIFEDPRDEEGWFTTGDRCEIREGQLRFLGRADDLVKVSGELVSVSEVRDRVRSLGAEVGLETAVVVVPDARRGNTFVLVVAGTEQEAIEFHAGLRVHFDGIARPGRVVAVETIPRTEIGKLDVAELQRLAGQ